MGPTEILRLLAEGSTGFECISATDALTALCFSTDFNRELAVVATDTGWRGRELLKGGESFG